MFGFFKKKSKVDVLQKQYEQMLKEAKDLSTVDRKASSIKYAEAQKLEEEIFALTQAEKKG